MVISVCGGKYEIMCIKQQQYGHGLYLISACGCTYEIICIKQQQNGYGLDFIMLTCRFLFDVRVILFVNHKILTYNDYINAGVNL